LSTRFKVTEKTIRNDLKRLQKQDLQIRSGVVPIFPGIGSGRKIRSLKNIGSTCTEMKRQVTWT